MSADPDMTAFTLLITGDPSELAWARARINARARRHFDDPKTKRAKADVRLTWIEAGAPRLADEPLTIQLEAVFERPQSHYRKDGELNAEGLRRPQPTKKPDADNLVKLVCDALNTRAYRDDAQIVALSVTKRWSDPHWGEVPHTRITIGLLDAELAT